MTGWESTHHTCLVETRQACLRTCDAILTFKTGELDMMCIYEKNDARPTEWKRPRHELETDAEHDRTCLFRTNERRPGRGSILAKDNLVADGDQRWMKDDAVDYLDAVIKPTAATR